MGPARKPRPPGTRGRGPARRVAASASLLLGLWLGTAAAEEPPPPESVEPAAPAAPQPTPAPMVLVPPAAASRPPCVLTPGADGRLSGVTAADGTPLARGGCRHSDFSGTLLTYHRSGAVAEILPVKGGLLDGVLEVYDELGHLLRRELWQDGALRPLAQLPLGEPLTPPLPRPEAPRPLPPPLPGPDPAASSPEPAATNPAATPAPTPSSSRQSPFGYPSPGLELHLALNVARGAYGTLAQLGPGLGLLIALSDRLVVELRSQFLGTVSGPDGYLRRDVPITLGLRTRFGASLVQPYLVAAIGTDYARRTIPGDIPSQPAESAWLLDAHAGAGMTVAMSRSWSLVGEFRLGARLRVDGGPRLTLPDESGGPQVQLGNQLNTQFCLGLALSL